MWFVHRCDLNPKFSYQTSDDYRALVDLFATPAAVEDRASTIREFFIEAGLIFTETSGDVSYGGEARLPGPLLTTACRFDQRGPDLPPEIPYWEYTVCSVVFISGKWINDFRLIVFASTTGPQCREQFEVNDVS